MTITPDHTAQAAKAPAPATGVPSGLPATLPEGLPTALPAGIPTERLQLDPITTAELDALIIQSRLADWAPDFPQPTDHDAARQFFEAGMSTQHHALTTHLIRERSTGQAVGTIGFLLLPEQGDVEVSYSVVPSRRGRGYATEALVALARHALDQPEVTRVLAYTEAENAASQSLLLTAGFLPMETSGLGVGFTLNAAQLPDDSL